jgi:hypothetical protein
LANKEEAYNLVLSNPISIDKLPTIVRKELAILGPASLNTIADIPLNNPGNPPKLLTT